MKRSLILSALTLLLCVLLAGCSNGYSSTPTEAYLQDIEQGLDISFVEIDCITINESKAIWFAVVNDDSITRTIMDVNDGKFRVDVGPTDHNVPDYSISDLENMPDVPALKDLTYYMITSESDSDEYQYRTLYYAFVLTELLPEIDEEHDYTLEHYIVPMKNGEETDLTLVYYFEEL